MEFRSIRRLIAGAALAAAAIALAMLAGAPLWSAILALVGGAAAIAVAHAAPAAPPAFSGPSEPAASALPGAAELLGAVDEPLLLVRSGRVLLANAAARTVLGQHIEGVDVRLAIRHPAAAERLAEGRTAEESERTMRAELTGLGERDRRWVMTASRVDERTRLVHLSDHSERHASEQMRTDFVANASHELRTPLATLLGFLETLQDDHAAEDKDTRSRFLGIMFDEARRMHRLVDDLISLSRIEAERFSLPRQSVPLLPLIDEVRAACGRLAEERGSTLVVENDLGGQPVVQGDRPQLLQLVQNVVVNALKYGRSGTPVTIRFEQADGGMLRMRVIDKGEGIAPQHLPRLTERFYRVDPGRSRAMGGTGLGLAIVKHIVGRHRGWLDIRSEIGVGTSVDVYIPCAPGGCHERVTEPS